MRNYLYITDNIVGIGVAAGVAEIINSDSYYECGNRIFVYISGSLGVDEFEEREEIALDILCGRSRIKVGDNTIRLGGRIMQEDFDFKPLTPTPIAPASPEYIEKLRLDLFKEVALRKARLEAKYPELYQQSTLNKDIYDNKEINTSKPERSSAETSGNRNGTNESPRREASAYPEIASPYSRSRSRDSELEEESPTRDNAIEEGDDDEHETDIRFFKMIREQTEGILSRIALRKSKEAPRKRGILNKIKAMLGLSSKANPVSLSDSESPPKADAVILKDKDNDVEPRASSSELSTPEAAPRGISQTAPPAKEKKPIRIMSADTFNFEPKPISNIKVSQANFDFTPTPIGEATKVLQPEMPTPDPAPRGISPALPPKIEIDEAKAPPSTVDIHKTKTDSYKPKPIEEQVNSKNIESTSEPSLVESTKLPETASSKEASIDSASITQKVELSTGTPTDLSPRSAPYDSRNIA